MEEKLEDSKVESTNPYQEETVREDLAALLSRVSSLQGVAVPAHRFVYQQQTESGIALEDMSVVDQVMAIWSARFPDGPVEKLSLDKLDKSSFPALWVSEDGEIERISHNNSLEKISQHLPLLCNSRATASRLNCKPFDLKK